MLRILNKNDVSVDVSDDDEMDSSVESDFDQNLAEVLPDNILQSISAQLLKDIEEDDGSRAEWLQMREQCLGLLGLKIMKPRTDVSSGGAPFEGLSTYQDAALLEACVRFQANARGELLPSGGPVKVENEGQQEKDPLAEALEKAINKFLTIGSPEYIPDTDQLLFQVGWSGAGFKKGFYCALRRRPVIESIDAKDLIVSNQAMSIDTASRVTHSISLSKTVIRRMQLLGVYRNIPLITPIEENKNAVDLKQESIQGIRKSSSQTPDNNERTLYECYTDLDIPGFEHTIDGEITGLPIPYKVTIDRSSKNILEIRRNYREDDEWCNKRKTFVMYPFIPAFGFYPIGLMHLIGNSTNGITAMTRMAIDNMMIGNFPYWFYAKGGLEQDKNDFRAGPGQGIPINVPVGGSIRDFLMPAPRTPLDPAFINNLEMLKSDTQRLAGTAEVQVGEGRQDAPVGTTIALLEQATKPMDAVHKRLHQAQCEELRMLRELLQEYPEALWQYTGKVPFNKEQLIQALDDYELVPQADPNVSSHMMRMAKAEAGKQLTKDLPMGMVKLKEAACLYCDQIGIPIMKQFIVDLPPPNPQMQQGPMSDPLKAQSMIQVQQMKSNDAAQARQLQAVQIAQKSHDDALDRQAKLQQHQDELAKEMVIHTTPPAQNEINNSPPQPIG